MIWPRLAPCSRPSVRHGHGECTFDVMVRVGAWLPSDRRRRFMLVAAARSYFLPRTVLTPRSAKRAEDSSMAQSATAATLLGGCSSPNACAFHVPPCIKGVRPSRICGDPRRFSQLFACLFRHGTPARHSFAGILLGRRRTLRVLKKPCRASGRKTADIDFDSQLHMFICKGFRFEKDPRSFQVARDTVDGDTARSATVWSIRIP